MTNKEVPPANLGARREPLDAMYPDIYWECYPVVKQMCEMYDDDIRYYPSRSEVEEMTDRICQRLEGDYDPDFNPDGRRRRDRRRSPRDIVLILLIRELLRRRNSF